MATVNSQRPRRVGAVWMVKKVRGVSIGGEPNGPRSRSYAAATLRLLLLSGLLLVFGRFSGSGAAMRAVAAWSTAPQPDEVGMMTVMCCCRPRWRSGS